MGHWLDASGVQLPDLVDILQNVLQLPGEFPELGLIERKPGQPGDMAGVFDADFMIGHGCRF